MAVRPDEIACPPNWGMRTVWRWETADFAKNGVASATSVNQSGVGAIGRSFHGG
jgi:hypothetical protein